MSKQSEPKSVRPKTQAKAKAASNTAAAVSADTASTASTEMAAEEISGYVVKEPAVAKDATGIRRFTLESFRSRRKRRQADRRESRTRIEHSFRIFNRSVGMIRRHWEVFGGLTLIYLLFNLLLAGGGVIVNNQLQETKSTATDLFGNESFGGYAGTAVAMYGSLLQTGTNLATGAASAYQMMLLVIFSLVFVWALRQLYAGKTVRVRDALYNATYPLVQVLLVLCMVLLHLVPAVAGMFAFSALVLGGIVVEPVLQVAVTVGSLLLVMWSAYLLSASLFALYIAALPDMSPLTALRSAKKLVKFRRGTVLRKLLYLPLVLVPLTVVFVLPFAFWLTPAATAVFYVVMTICVPFIHTYLYTLYRELIQANG